MGSMHTGLEESKNGYEKMAAYYAERAAGGAGLIVTGGIAPNRAGWVSPFAAKLTTKSETRKHQKITDAVHAEGGKICMQILHSGRYGYHPFIVAPSSLKAPITPFKPKALTKRGIKKSIQDFINCAVRAKEAGYDGVEVMGSEGYLINQFIVKRTNKRTDEWGGAYENRIRFPLEIVSGIRKAVGTDFIVIYRLSMLDLVEDGSTIDEVEHLAHAIEKAGATIINTGIGWHEARIPTIATMVPRGGFSWVTKRLMGKVKIPLITTNRINTPELAEDILAKGHADMVSMARPFLADPAFPKKAQENRAKDINTCIACNQACLDHIFERKTSSCLVNPRACRELEFELKPAPTPKKVAVVGAGPAGLSCAVTAAERGHHVTLFEANSELGGQFNLAQKIPGKEEFKETMRYYREQAEKFGVDLKLGTKATEQDLLTMGFDALIISTGVKPRMPDIPGIDHPKVSAYNDLILGKCIPGKRVAVIGGGGIGVDVSTFLLDDQQHSRNEDGFPALEHFLKEWGIDNQFEFPGGIKTEAPSTVDREVFLLKRSPGKIGKGMGKTTAWIHRRSLKLKGLNILNKVKYERIDDEGLHIIHNNEEKILEVDNIIVCAGQEPVNELYEVLKTKHPNVHIIGGARLAAELDAKRAIEEGYKLALEI